MSKTALVYATPRALEQAERLLPRGTVLESIARDAIERQAHYGAEYAGWIFLEDFGLAARFRRVPGHVRVRPRAWLITNVELKRSGPRRGGALARAAAPEAGRALLEGSGGARPAMTTTE